MSLVPADRVLSSTTTTGTGAYSLGSGSNGYQAFSVLGDGNTTYYSVTDGTDWEVGLGTYSSSGNTLTRTSIISSSNSGNAVNWSSGSKQVFCTLPAIASPVLPSPSIPDSGSVADTTIWENLRAILLQSVYSGRRFETPPIEYIALPFAPSSGNYLGGFCGLDGAAVAFITGETASGSKATFVSMLGTFERGVGNYNSLSFVSSTNQYRGTIVLPKGSAVMVPFNTTNFAVVRPPYYGYWSSLTSTYSLTGLVASAHLGGVVNLKGEGHFVPHSSSVGRKITEPAVVTTTSAYTVTTYALGYTTASAYAGGCLAPNGDIHFVPHDAVVGQKVAHDGTVSTYALAYTTTGAYYGGVIDLNGDIHFVPHNAAVGQKVQRNGTVSTYALAYTTTGAYRGGVLSPIGEIYFVNFNSGVGQKVHALTGAVTTYNLIYTGVGRYSGGVLDETGTVIFTSGTSPDRVLWIRTCPGTPFPLEARLSPFLNKSI